MVNSGKRFLISQKIINYSSYLQRKDNCPIDKQILLMTKALHHTGKNSYYSNLLYGSVSQGLGTTKFTNLIG